MKKMNYRSGNIWTFLICSLSGRYQPSEWAALPHALPGPIRKQVIGEMLVTVRICSSLLESGRVGFGRGGITPLSLQGVWIIYSKSNALDHSVLWGMFWT